MQKRKNEKIIKRETIHLNFKILLANSVLLFSYSVF